MVVALVGRGGARRNDGQPHRAEGGGDPKRHGGASSWSNTGRTPGKPDGIRPSRASGAPFVTRGFVGAWEGPRGPMPGRPPTSCQAMTTSPKAGDGKATGADRMPGPAAGHRPAAGAPAQAGAATPALVVGLDRSDEGGTHGGACRRQGGRGDLGHRHRCAEGPDDRRRYLDRCGPRGDHGGPSLHEPGLHEPGLHEPGLHEPGLHEPGLHEHGRHGPGPHSARCGAMIITIIAAIRRASCRSRVMRVG